MRPIIAEDRPVVERVWQLYRHDLSEFRGEHDPSGLRGTLPLEDGTFNARGLLPYLQENADRAAYLFRIGARPVGFALTCGLTSEPRLVAEFFVVRGARRPGVGRAAVQKLLALYPGGVGDSVSGAQRCSSSVLARSSDQRWGAMRFARNVGLFRASRECRRMSGSRSRSSDNSLRGHWDTLALQSYRPERSRRRPWICVALGEIVARAGSPYDREEL
jgi:predicted acetyltransferase